MASGTRSCRVIIVGGGMAGLSAARHLHKHAPADHTLSIKILEASERIGGRIQSKDFVGSCVDLGAMYVEGASEENPIIQLVREYGLTLQAHIHLGSTFFQEGEELTKIDAKKTMASLDAALARVIGDGEPPFEIGDSASVSSHMQDTLIAGVSPPPSSSMVAMPATGEHKMVDLIGRVVKDEDPSRLAHAISQHENYIGASFEQASAKWFGFDDDFEGGPSPMIKESYGCLPSHLGVELHEAGIEILHGCRVTHVQQDQGSLMHVVSSHSGEVWAHDADYVIMTASLGVLKAGLISFDPQLPDSHRDAIAKLGFGGQERVVMTFESRFWPEGIGSFVSIPAKGVGEVIPVFVCSEPACSPSGATLSAFVTNSTAMRWALKKDEEIIDILMSTLSSGLGIIELPPLLQYHVTRWSKDVNFLGSWSYIAAGSAPTDFDKLAQPLCKGRLFLAGEATSSRHFSTVHGAYITGKQAAEHILEDIARNLNT